MAYQTGQLSLQAMCNIRITRKINGEMRNKLIRTTVGRIIFNEAIPQDLGFVERRDPEDAFKLEIDRIAGKKLLGDIVGRCFRVHGASETSQMLDRIKKLGYNYCTKAGVTVGYMDVKVPQEKSELIDKAEGLIKNISEKFRYGLLAEEERYQAVIKVWENTTNAVTTALEAIKAKDPFNPIHMMADSGARGSMQQIRQLAGMRGLMKSPTGRTIEMPIRANFARDSPFWSSLSPPTARARAWLTRLCVRLTRAI